MPRNYGISQDQAIAIALVAALIALAATVVTALAYGVSQGAATIVMPLVGSLAACVVGLSGAIKAAESADSAAKARQDVHSVRTAVELTASQVATIQQYWISHCGDLCPAAVCPLRTMLVEDQVP